MASNHYCSNVLLSLYLFINHFIVFAADFLPKNDECWYESLGAVFNANSALVNCSYLPMEFLECEPPEDLKGNHSARDELGYGCTKFGRERWDEIQGTSVKCQVLDDIECYGSRSFLKEGFPCIRYTGHYFVTTMIYSVLLGFLGMDRFCLGHTCTAVSKLLTLGGVGIWWILDIVLLVTGRLKPEDGSNWMPYY